MRLTVLGGCGAWPGRGQACSGYLLEHEGFLLLIDPGYASVARLLERSAADRIDAVVISHGHPDHCADLNPLLRARALVADPPPPLPVYAGADALQAVLALDRPETLAGTFTMEEMAAGRRTAAGPFSIEPRDLPHFVPNLGLRISAGSTEVAYTGDTGATTEVVELAVGTGLLLAEASFVRSVPARSAGNLNSAAQVGRIAALARVGRLVLTHLWPGTDPAEAREGAAAEFAGPVDVAAPD